MLGSPANILRQWSFRLLSVGLVIVGIALVAIWFSGSVPTGSIAIAGRFGSVAGILVLVAGAGCLFWGMMGHRLQPARLRARKDGKIPVAQPGDVQYLVRPDGSKLFVEVNGDESLPTAVLVHGWSLNSGQWVYLQQEWRDKFRIVTWDLAGMGQSTGPDNYDYSIDKMAHDLRAVVETCGSRPVVLMGHSIGGMVILKFCELFPELQQSRVSKLVLVHTTYTNPLKTMAIGKTLASLQRVLIEPLIYLQIYTWPLIWLADYLAYMNGSLHWSLQHTGFAGRATREQVDFVARFYANDSPATLARGALGMLAFDGTPAFSVIKIPVLVVGGAQDPLTDIDASRTIAGKIKGAELIVMNPAKHFGLIEYHRDFAEQAAEFCLK